MLQPRAQDEQRDDRHELAAEGRGFSVYAPADWTGAMVMETLINGYKP